MNEVKLLSCPFCGGEAKHYYIYPDMHSVTCTKCSAKVFGYMKQSGAVNAWNRRKDDERKGERYEN